MRHLWKTLRSAKLAPLVIAFCVAAGWAQSSATPGTGSVIVGGIDQGGFDPCLGENGANVTDEGTVTITINGTEIHTVQYGPTQAGSTTTGSVANALTNDINLHSPLVTATVNATSIGVITLTARSPGSQTNYSLTTSTTYNQSLGCTDPNTGVFVPVFTAPSFTLVPSGPTLTGGADASLQGYVNPKYVILAWTYAPPGSKSSVVYNNSTMVGSSTTNNDSFANQVTESVTIAGTTGSVLGKLDGVEVSGTESTSYTDEQDSSKSISINQTKTFITTVPGPSNDAFGVNHDYDVVWLWLNPLADFTVFPNLPNSVLWTGYHFDMSDIPNMDVFGVQMGWLNGHFGTLPADIQHVLDRTWAAGQTWPAGQGPGLTGPGPGTDFDNIVKANPFSDPTYTVTVPPGAITSADGRFTVTANSNIDYVPPGPSGSPTTQSYSANYVQTDTKGQGAKYAFSEGFATEEKFTGPAFLSDLVVDLKQSDTMTWTHQFSQTMTQSAGNTASFSVTGPAATANYSGPTEFLVFQDNIFGTFMFYPVNQAPDFAIGASPSTQTVPAGGQATYTVSTTALRGFSGSTNLTVGGLPTGASASFAPASLAGTGASSLTITIPASVAAGNYPLVITGTSGTLSHSAQATLTVIAPDFSISATPTTQTITAGGNTTYTVSTGAINGFTGSVSLGTSGLPTGATASFSPASITGSTTSTLTISTLSSTPAATYTITITGIGGSINHSTAVLLTVNAPTGGVTISAPANNSNQSTSVRVTASASEPTSQIGQMQIWDNGVRLGINNGSAIDQTFTLSVGAHRITVEDLSAGTFTLLHSSVVNITVFADGVTITSPADGANVTGPVHVAAFATESAAQVGQIQVWDNGQKLDTINATSVDRTYTLSTGAHRLTVEDLTAGTFQLLHKTIVNITVQ
jgi:hypothetical protein